VDGSGTAAAPVAPKLDIPASAPKSTSARPSPVFPAEIVFSSVAKMTSDVKSKPIVCSVLVYAGPGTIEKSRDSNSPPVAPNKVNVQSPGV